MSNTPEVGLMSPASRLVLDGGALVVRPLELGDAPAVVAAIAESLAELRRFMPWAHAPQTLASQKERIKGVNAAYWRGDDFGMGAFAGGEFVGGFGLHPRTLNPRGLELGYWVRTGRAGQGMCTRVARALVAYAFRWLGCERVQCAHNEANRASAAVIAKCGFLYEGTLRRFEPSPSAAMVAAGCEAVDGMRLYALIESDLARLSWLEEATATLEVYDWLGRRAPVPLALSPVPH